MSTASAEPSTSAQPSSVKGTVYNITGLYTIGLNTRLVFVFAGGVLIRSLLLNSLIFVVISRMC